MFASVIVNFREAVFQAAPQLRPQVERVAAGFGQRAAGQEVFVQGGSVEFAHELVEERQTAFRADLFAGGFVGPAFLELALDGVEFADPGSACPSDEQAAQIQIGGSVIRSFPKLVASD